MAVPIALCPWLTSCDARRSPSAEASLVDAEPAAFRRSVPAGSLRVCLTSEASRPFATGRRDTWRWPAGSLLTVRFLNGSPALQKRTVAVARAWSAIARVAVAPTTSRAARVRVRFTDSNASWSRIGTSDPDAYRDPDSATMALGNVTEATPADSFSAVVLHEFGHALGLTHAPRPERSLDWNESAIIDYFARSYGWSADDVRLWVFGEHHPGDVAERADDSLSVMQYPLPGALTYSGRGGAFNDRLSDGDRRSMAAAYR